MQPNWEVPRPPATSPCIGVCTLDATTGLCRGCLRTMAEISSWPDLEAVDQQRVLDQLFHRRAALGDKSGR